MSGKHRLVLVLLAVVGVFFVLFGTSRSGVGLTPDSVGYIATARNLINGFEAVSWDAKPLVVQPPLYPALLASVGYFSGYDPLSCARIVNASLFGLAVYVSGLLFFTYLNLFPALAMMGTVTVLVSAPLLQVSMMAWSEPLYILLVLVSLLLANSYRVTGKSTSLLFLAGSVALASMTRYIGIALIPVGVLLIFFSNHGTLGERASHLLLFLLVSTSPLAAWVVRNYVVSGTLFGPRYPADTTVLQVLERAYHFVRTWYIPDALYQRRSLLVCSSATVGFLAGLILKEGDWRRVRSVFLETSPVILYLLFYAALLIYSSRTVGMDRLNSRLLSPVYVPLNLVLLCFAQSLLKPIVRGAPSRVVLILLLAGIAVWAPFSARQGLIEHPVFRRDSSGLYNSMKWRDSETIRYLQHQPLGSADTVYCNDPYALYILSGIVAKLSPAKTQYNSPEPAYTPSELGGLWPDGEKGYLIWFSFVEFGYLYTLEELQTISGMKQMTKLGDGAIYIVSKK